MNVLEHGRLARWAPAEVPSGLHTSIEWAARALGGIGLAATSFLFLLISERTPLFGFMEPGYDPAAILASRVAEGAAVLFLGGLLVARLTGRARAR